MFDCGLIVASRLDAHRSINPFSACARDGRPTGTGDWSARNSPFGTDRVELQPPAHSSDMVQTLDTYPRRERSLVQTAKELGIHRQTVVYRMQRIEEITGRRIGDTAALAEFWLALRARDLLAS